MLWAVVLIKKYCTSDSNARQEEKANQIIEGNADQVTPRKIAHEKHDFHNTPPFPGAFSDFISTSGVYKTSCCSLARMLEQGTEVQMWV